MDDLGHPLDRLDDEDAGVVTDCCRCEHKRDDNKQAKCHGVLSLQAVACFDCILRRSGIRRQRPSSVAGWHAMGDHICGPVAGVVQLRVQIHPDDVRHTKVHEGLTERVHVGYERLDSFIKPSLTNRLYPLNLLEGELCVQT